MKIAVYHRKSRIDGDRRFGRLLKDFEAAGCVLYPIYEGADIQDNTDMLMSVGGDGTFLSASALQGERGIPILGVNLGRLGFLSENPPETVVESVMAGDYVIEDRPVLKACLSSETGCPGIDLHPYAFNEITVHRSGAAMLGVEVKVDGSALPTYWADGLLVATSSGSTAYSLSVGGPIVLPESKVLIISPIAPHNLNVRPLIVPDGTVVSMSLRARDKKVMLTMDNRTVEVQAGITLDIAMAQFSLKRVRLNSSNFINALTSKLFWGEDIRNGRY